MSSATNRFIPLALMGKVMIDDIDDFVDAWHASPAGMPLHEFLGMSPEEYSVWLHSPESLSSIIAGRRLKQVS